MDVVSCKRENYLEWQEYFMSIAFLSAQRSKDPRTQVGACIVNKDKKIVGIGYNGMPMGCSDDKMPWNRAENDTKEKWLKSKSPYVCHAELNAVLNKNQADITGCSIYVALFPCNMCAQIIIQSGITEVIYYSDKYHGKPEFVASRFLLDTAGVQYRQFKPRQKTIKIDFELIENTAGANPTMPVLPVASTECDAKDGERNISNSVNDFISSTEENICNSAVDIDKAVHKCCSTEAMIMKKRMTVASSKDLVDVNNSFTGRDEALKNLMDNENGILANQNIVTTSELSVMEVRYALFSIFFIVFLVLYTWFIAKNV